MDTLDQRLAPQTRLLLDQLRDVLSLGAIEAVHIREKFQTGRSELQQSLRHDLMQQTPALTSREVATQIYSPLMLDLRIVGDEISLDWRFRQWPNRDASLLVLTTPRRNAAGNYHIASLLAHAQQWERNLVREAELQCRPLRRRQNDMNRCIQLASRGDDTDADVGAVTESTLSDRCSNTAPGAVRAGELLDSVQSKKTISS